MRVKNRNVAINFVIDQETQAEIRKIALAEDRSMSSIVRAAVREYLDAGAGTDTGKKAKPRAETSAAA